MLMSTLLKKTKLMEYGYKRYRLKENNYRCVTVQVDESGMMWLPIRWYQYKNERPHPFVSKEDLELYLEYDLDDEIINDT